MSPDQDPPARLIWATRGHTWGFRLLIDGELPDPLRAYERAFANLTENPTACRRLAETVALRFPDPLGRRDSAGRVIPHEFVVFDDLAVEIESVEGGLHRVWPLVADTYAQIWDRATPPSTAHTLRHAPRTDTTAT